VGYAQGSDQLQALIRSAKVADPDLRLEDSQGMICESDYTRLQAPASGKLQELSKKMLMAQMNAIEDP